MKNREVTTLEAKAKYDGPLLTLGDILLDDKDVPAEFFIPEEELPRWEYLKGSKTEKRINKDYWLRIQLFRGKYGFPRLS